MSDDDTQYEYRITWKVVYRSEDEEGVSRQILQADRVLYVGTEKEAQLLTADLRNRAPDGDNYLCDLKVARRQVQPWKDIEL